jgi:O-antigen/teichoic acid export membrane protein
LAKFLDDLQSVVVSKVAIIFFGLFKVILVARWLGPEMNGTISALAVYPTIFMHFGALGLRKSSAFFIGTKTFDEAKIKKAIVQVWLFSSLFSLISCFLLIRLFSSSGDNLSYVLLAILPIPFSLLVNYISGIFLGKNQINISSRIDWMLPVFTLTGTIVFVVIVNFSVTGALIAEALGQITLCFIIAEKK